MAIVYKAKTHSPEIFADASHAIHRDMKGHNGVIIQLGDASVFHKSCKQKMNCKSSTEAELVNLSDSVPMTIWCNNFIRELGYDMPPVFMLQDNVSTITMVNGRSSASVGY